MLEIEKLSVRTDGKEIIRGLGLRVRDGEVHALMGPNGSGKTTLAYAIAGHPKYECSGKIKLDGKNLLGLPADERAKLGIFLAFQNPAAVEGVSLLSFLRKAKGSGKEDIVAFGGEMEKIAKEAGMDASLLFRDLNSGLSGGERKKSEIAQMLALKPKVAILDEIDSGLDVDALKAVAGAVSRAKDRKLSVIAITHHANLLKYLKPDFVHIMIEGKIVKTGDAKFAGEIEKKGYERMKNLE